MAEPWIRVHAQLLQKPVVGRAAAALGISRHEAMGVLVTFWSSVSQLAVNGRVGHYDDEQLESWACWGRKRGKFAAFVRAHHLDTDGRVNEWDDYAGPLETRRQKDRDRKRKSRGQSSGSHADCPRDFRETSALTRANETKRNETSSSSSAGVWQPVLETRLAERLPTATARQALSAVLHVASSDVGKFGTVQVISAMLDGERGSAYRVSGEVMGAALVAYVANGMSRGEWSTRHFEAFVIEAARPQTPEKPASASTPNGRAALLMDQIRDLVQVHQQPGQAERRFIKMDDVKTLGDDVLRAYKAIGGADAILKTPGEKWSFLVRDFAAALEASHAAA